MKNIILGGLVTLVLFMGGMVLLPASARADYLTAPTIAPECDKSAGFLSFPTWYKYLQVDNENGNCEIKLPEKVPAPAEGNKTDIGATISRILLAVFEMILRVAGILAIIFIMWGGIQYQLSQGEPDRMSKARSVMINALIGLTITISATAIVNLVARNIL